MRSTLPITLKRQTLVGMLAAALTVGGCASRVTHTPAPDDARCAGELAPYVRNVLYFGLTSASLPNGEVTPELWRAFSRDVLTAHFPDGMTVIDAHGAWRGADGRRITEPSRVVIAFFPAAQHAASVTAVKTVITEAKRRLAQEAVLWEQSEVCAAF